MSATGALERAARELVDGHPWLAADRLQSALALDPGRDEVRTLLGEAYLAMDDDVRAGRVLAQTERTDPDATRAFDAWVASLGDPKRLTRRAVRDVMGTGATSDGRLAELGPVARARLSPIVSAVLAEVDRLEQVGKRIDGLTERQALIDDGWDPGPGREPPTEPGDRSKLVAEVATWSAAAVIVVGLVQIGSWIGLW